MSLRRITGQVLYISDGEYLHKSNKFFIHFFKVHHDVGNRYIPNSSIFLINVVYNAVWLNVLPVFVFVLNFYTYFHSYRPRRGIIRITWKLWFKACNS